MKIMNYTGTRAAIISVLTLFMVFRAESQSGIPDMLLKGTLREQMQYLQEKTRIYEDYRAIREDMFQKIKNNSLDSLMAAKKEIIRLEDLTAGLELKIDTLNRSLETVRQDLDTMTKTKNSIRLLGINVNKAAYNAVMWIIIAILAGLLTIGFLVFKRNFSVTIHTKKEFEDLQKEFEAYRKASREAREKMSMAHFNELKKIRGG
jgi:hypothetical protein